VGAKGFEFVLRAKLDPKALGAELRRLREQSRVSVGDLAERMGWHSQNVSRLESGGGAREPTIASVNLYVRMLGYELVFSAKPKPAGRRKSVVGAERASEPGPHEGARSPGNVLIDEE
jgi:transcriptional regulator with XRE-family HTH domain